MNELATLPNLCIMCDHTDKWPKCMSNPEFRGHHPVLKDTCQDDVVKCDNHIFSGEVKE